MIVGLLFLGTSLFAQQAEFGEAGYYGNKFHKKPTANGELYDMYAMTAAHKTLPFGTKIRVTRIDNDKSVIVRVNDRGPYIAGRIVDMSYKSAKELGMIDDGITKVKLEIVGTESTPPPSVNDPLVVDNNGASEINVVQPKAPEFVPPPTPQPEKKKAQKTEKKASIEPRAEQKPSTTAQPVAVGAQGALVTRSTFRNSGVYKIELRQPVAGNFGVQVAAHQEPVNAYKELALLQGRGHDNVLVGMTQNGKKTTYKTILGPFSTREEASAYAKSLLKKYRTKGFVVDLSQF